MPQGGLLTLQATGYFYRKQQEGVTKLANFTESKKGGDEVIPLEFNLPSLSWKSFNGIQNLGLYFAHLRKRKKAYQTKWFEEKKAYQSQVTRIDLNFFVQRPIKLGYISTVPYFLYMRK